MIRVLVFGMTENPGGVESFLINYYRHINKRIIQWDFFCNSYNPVAYEQELIECGARCYHITARSDDWKKYRAELENVFREHAQEWDVIWVNVCSLANIDYLKIAKKYGINRRIIHSHNSENMDNLIRGLLHKINKRQIQKFATDFWACSDEAARWFYEKRIIQNSVVIHNAIDVERMKYDKGKRDLLRSKYGWQNKYIIGNIGRLHFQKNQLFVLEVFAQYLKVNEDAFLILVGQGDDLKMLKNKSEELELKNNVFFAGVQNDIQGWLSSFDLFLFPSRFEGLSIAALEAQANGLTTIASRRVIPEDVKMNENFYFMDLDLGADEWCKKIEELSDVPRANYKDVKQHFEEKGYDIVTEKDKLENLLLSQGK